MEISIFQFMFFLWMVKHLDWLVKLLLNLYE